MTIEKPVIAKIRDTVADLNAYEASLEAKPEGTKEKTCISSWTKEDFDKEIILKELCKNEGIEPVHTIARYTEILERINI